MDPFAYLHIATKFDQHQFLKMVSFISVCISCLYFLIKILGVHRYVHCVFNSIPLINMHVFVTTND